MEQTLPLGGSSASPTSPATSRRIKDAPTRAAHAWIAISFAVAYITADGEAWRLVHVIAGYSMVIALGFRLLWAVFGPRSVGFSAWTARGRALGHWLGEQLRPAGWKAWITQPRAALQRTLQQGVSLSILVLLLVLPLMLLTGYLGWSELAGEWASELHESLGEFSLPLVLAHIGVLFGLMAVRRQNVLQSMWSGRVAGKGPDLVPHNRSWLAMLLGAVVVVFAVWYWQDASQRLPDGVSMPSLSQLASQGGHDDDDD